MSELDRLNESDNSNDTPFDVAISPLVLCEHPLHNFAFKAICY